MNKEELLKNAKPILFNTEMVQAILEGRKTVTRRKIDRDITNFCDVEVDGTLLDYQNCHGDFINPVELCIYKVRDILYVRETFNGPHYQNGYKNPSFLYKADLGENIVLGGKWKPSIHMPKEAARIFLKVIDVRVEKLWDMTQEDCIQEGCGELSEEEFAQFWDSTIKKQDLDKYGWEANPWVWVVEFKMEEVANE